MSVRRHHPTFAQVRRAPHLAEYARAHREWMQMRREMLQQNYDVPEDPDAID